MGKADILKRVKRKRVMAEREVMALSHHPLIVALEVSPPTHVVPSPALACGLAQCAARGTVLFRSHTPKNTSSVRPAPC